jgi:hypothetical protein
MTKTGSQPPLQRRSFIGRLGVGVTAFAAAISGSRATAEAQSGTTVQWQPSRHEVDDWMDKIPGKHRMIFDTVDPEGFGTALPFANNYFRANQSGYSLNDSDSAVIIVARHSSTPFAYNDAIWAKYGVTIAQRAKFMDPKTKSAPKSNLYNATGYEDDELANRGTTLDTVLKRGVHLAVCQLATRGYAGAIATAVGSDTDTIYKELSANLVANSHLVPAGIVAVNRAQERGYAFVRA